MMNRSQIIAEVFHTVERDRAEARRLVQENNPGRSSYRRNAAILRSNAPEFLFEMDSSTDTRASASYFQER